MTDGAWGLTLATPHQIHVARGFNYSLVTKEESIGYKRVDKDQVAFPGVRVRFRPNSTTGLARSEVSKAACECRSGKGERVFLAG